MTPREPALLPCLCSASAATQGLQAGAKAQRRNPGALMLAAKPREHTSSSVWWCFISGQLKDRRRWTKLPH